MWILGIKALLADRGKLVTSLLGVTFSVVLVNLQGGLYLGMLGKASLLVDFGRADIWVGHRHMNNVDLNALIPERWVDRLRSVPGVERAEPYLLMPAQIAMPDGNTERVIVVGCDAASLLGNTWVMADGDAAAIRRPDAVLVDVCDAGRLGDCRVGDVREIGGRRARVVGMTYGVVGFATTPYVFTTLHRARTLYVPAASPDQCSYFLVKARPGTDIAALVAVLRQRVPELDVHDKATFSGICANYWLTRTAIGISFGLATFLGLLVGLVMVAQTLYASVAERVKEYGTLKALGASDSCMARYLVVQALGNAVLGSVTGLLGALLIGSLLNSPRAPVIFTGWVMGGSVLLITLVCLLASWAPYWRIRKIDPASVLRS
jgi:putative ABC transport system permease protein